MPSQTAPLATDAVRSLVARPVATVSEDASLREIAEALVGDEVGALLVLHQDVPVGIVSERDIVRAIAEGADPADVSTSDVMTFDTVWAAPSDPIVEVGRTMLDAGVRHMPIRTDERVIGMVSIRDVVRVMLHEPVPQPAD